MSAMNEEDPKTAGLMEILEMLLNKGADKYRPKPDAKGEVVAVKIGEKPDEEKPSSKGDELVDNLLGKKDDADEEASETPEEEEEESWVEKALKAGKLG